MDHERPIEKLLRRHAKQRREEAGAPLELHPATRRLLQGEVARQYRPDTAVRDENQQVNTFWTTFWPRLVWSVPVLLVVGLGVWSLLKEETGSPRAFAPTESGDLAESLATRSEPAITGVADALKDLETPRPAAASPPAQTLAMNEASPLTGSLGAFGDEKRIASSIAPKAESASAIPSAIPPATAESSRAKQVQLTLNNTEAQAGSGAGGALAPGSPSRAVERQPTVSRPASAEVAISTSAAPVPVTSAPTRYARAPALARGGGGEADTSPELAQSFSNLGVAVPDIAKSRTEEVVLANFEVRQTGDQVRVIDSDGSTYTGVISQMAADSTGAAAGQREQVTFALKEDANTVTRRYGAAPAASPVTQPAQSNLFRVTGTNRTLNQQVVFTWNFVDPSNALAAAKAKGLDNYSSLQTPRLGQQFPAMLQNSGISGRAQLNGGREIEVNAVPVQK